MMGFTDSHPVALIVIALFFVGGLIAWRRGCPLMIVRSQYE